MKGSTSIYGILGDPVKHSRSPAMQNAAFAALGIDAAYVPFHVSRERLGEAIAGLRALGVRGANVTLPHKEAVIAHLDAVDDDARWIGAVNTLVRDGDRFLGFNTDAPGLVRSLEEAGVPIAGARLCLLGAGGAARAALVGLARAGASAITVAARRVEQARALLDELSPALEGIDVEARSMEADALRSAFERSSLVVQSTSATLEGSIDADAFAAHLPVSALPDDATVVDLVYKPRKTTVLRVAEARGLRTVDGLGMLLHQGALAFEHWTGRSAPIDVMRRALDVG